MGTILVFSYICIWSWIREDLVVSNKGVGIKSAPYYYIIGIVEISKEELKEIHDDNLKRLMILKIRRVNDLALADDPKEKESIQKNINELDGLINFLVEDIPKVDD